MKNLFLLFILYFLALISFAQDNNKIDSLKQILKKLPELNGTDADTTRMKVTLNIAELFERSHPDTAIYYYQSIIDTSIFKNKVLFKEEVKNNKEKHKFNANSMYFSGILYIYRGEYPISLSLLLKSLKIFDELHDKFGIAKCLNALGNVSNNGQSDYPKAIEYFEKALIIAEELEDRRGSSKCLVNLGVVAKNQENYTKAIEYYEKALKIAEELEDKNGISNCLINLGSMSWNQGDYIKAIKCFEKALKIAEEIKDKKQISYCLHNIGTVAKDQGDYPKAIEYLEKALEIAVELKDKEVISNSLTNFGAVAICQGNYLKAIEYFEKALEIREELKDKQGISKCFGNIGCLSADQGNYPKAIEFLEKALEIAEELEDNEVISFCLINLGVVLAEQDDYTKAIEYFEKSLEIREELKDKQGISNCLMNMGVLSKDQDEYPKSIEYYEKALKIAEEIGDKANLANNYPALAKAYIHQNMEEKAMSLFLKSQEITLYLLKDNFTILSEKEKDLYLAQTKSVFNDIHAFNINYKDPNDSLSGICYNNELVLKGLLLKSTAAVMDVVYKSNDSRVKDAFGLLKQYRDQISSLQGTEKSNRDSLIAEIEKLANEQERTLVRLSSEFAGIQNLFENKWEDVQKNLRPGEAAIEFVSFNQGNKNDTTVYAALLITTDSKQPQTIRLFEESELQAILGKTTGTGYNYVNSLYSANSNALYNLVWQPLEPALAGINTVYFALVGVLNKISFAALAKEPGKMLCDIYNLQQVSTTGKLINKETSPEIKMTAAVFGGIDYNPDTVKLDAWKYLPGTLNEKNNIEKLLKKNKINCQSFSGKEAKEENFKALFDSTEAPSILHVSTHGFFYPDPENRARAENENEEKGIQFRGSNGFGNWMFVNNKNPMMRSGLVFAGANRVWYEDWGRTDDEGILTALEVSRLNMKNTGLVVLSACETGLGDIKGSEGVYGLQRAFKMAGVKYIIMSLWQVPDKETVEFMEMFYKKLLKEKDVRLAFNETQKEMRKKYDPYFWGAFVLVE